ncbi:serine/threonine-protein phosphatase 2B catalytic subunit [Pancytospora philotis]|nr:serine/threonine-protein phosphatase 2B catalytic subunit [Pancytospora philotis]
MAYQSGRASHMEIKTKPMPLAQTYCAGKEDAECTPARANPAVPAVAAHKIPDIAILSQKCGRIDLDIVRTHFLNEGRLSALQVAKIFRDAGALLRAEPNLLEIDRKCYIIGDIHGQYYDLVAILSNFDLSRDTLLFLGDYVDRGPFSTEAYLYLLLLKIHHPDNVYLLRGNHESRKMTSYFTFRAECIHKYSEAVYEQAVASFMNLPIAALVQGRAFCCHGGLSPALVSARDLNKFNRFREIDYKGVICDLLWSDPHPSYVAEGRNWQANHNRNCSYFYNYSLVCDFLEHNGLASIIRGHEVQQNGFQMYKSYLDEPSVVTVFSAPNYCDAYKNTGAILEYDGGVVCVHQFEAVDHPFVLRGFIDGINWSMPFIFEQLLELVSAVLEELRSVAQADEESSETNEASDSGTVSDRPRVAEAIQEILTAGELEEIKVPITAMRMERECLDEFGDDEESTCSCTTLHAKATEVDDFDDAKKKDADNETSVEADGESPKLTIDLSPSLQSDALKAVVAAEPSELAAEAALKKRSDRDDEAIERSASTARKRWWSGKCCFQ